MYLVTYKKKYNPHDAPAPHTFGVTPWYNPLKPSFLPIVTSALAIPLYWGRAVEIAKPSLTEKKNWDKYEEWVIKTNKSKILPKKNSILPFTIENPETRYGVCKKHENILLPLATIFFLT